MGSIRKTSRAVFDRTTVAFFRPSTRARPTRACAGVTRASQSPDKMRRQQRHRHEQAAQPAEPRVFAHHPAIGDNFGSADLEDRAVTVVRQVECGFEVREHVGDGDGLRQRRDPARADHHRKPFDERLNHFKRQAAGADDDGGAKLDDGDAARSEHVTGFHAALEMGRERPCAAGQSAQIHDPLHACARGGASEVVGGAAIDVREVGSAAHRVHQVIRGVHAGERPVERRFVEAISLDDLSVRTSRGKAFRMPREAAHGAAALFESSKKTAADVSRRSGEQNVSAHR